MLLTVIEMLRDGENLETATVDKIAERAGVSTATIGKLWPAKNAGSVKRALFGECLDCVLGQVPSADRGGLEAELRAYLRYLADLENRSELSAILRSTVCANPAVTKRARRGCLEVPTEIARRAKARGELAEEIGISEAADLIWSVALCGLVASSQGSVEAAVRSVAAALTKPERIARAA